MRTHLPILSLALFLACDTSPCADTADDPDYRLVWADGFDKDGVPDPGSWEAENGFVRNHELQWYQAANARCQDGILTIEARREAVPNPEYASDAKDWRKKRRQSEFTSASLVTRGRHTWRYGRFEMRARIPTAQGTWPAFWTLGSAREWPACGEVDIMEAYKGKLLANLVWGSGKRWVGKWDSEKVPLAELGEGWEKEFHTWRMDWDERRIVLSVDGRVLNESDLDERKNPDGTEPFREPHYLLVNLAVGGEAAGDPGATVFPQRLEVDWVRVYERKVP